MQNAECRMQIDHSAFCILHSAFCILHSLSPAAQEVVLEAKLIADPANDEIDTVLQTLRPDVKGRHGRKDDGPRLGTGSEITQVNGVQGRLRGTRISLRRSFK